jgi:O-antigen ligase
VGGVESGFGSIIIEMGIVGFLLWISMAIAIFVAAWKAVRELKGSPWFPVAFMIFWYAFLLLIPLTYEGLQAYQDFILNAYMWLLLGVLFRLPKLALDAQFGDSAALQPGRRWIR